jgi:tRNA (adenine37-N6)-methyltransferase
MPFDITPIGHVRSSRSAAQDDNWDAESAHIALDATRFTPDALAGLSDFSHADVIFLFDQVPDEKIETGARHPRGRQDWPQVGIFAQRGKNRPNRIGLTTCRILAVDGLTVVLKGLDAIDGTPVLDIKPVMREFLPRGDIRQPAWVSELMADYWAPSD